MHYRLYHPEDFPALYAIEKICFQSPIRFSRRYLGELIAAPGSLTWVAEENGQPVGFAIVDVEALPEGTIAYIQTIEVLPDYRNRGAGATLLQQLEDSARAAGAQGIWLHVDSLNTGAMRLYERHGYRHQGRREHYYAHDRAAEIYLKRLSAVD